MKDNLKMVAIKNKISQFVVIRCKHVKPRPACFMQSDLLKANLSVVFVPQGCWRSGP